MSTGRQGPLGSRSYSKKPRFHFVRQNLLHLVFSRYFNIAVLEIFSIIFYVPKQPYSGGTECLAQTQIK